MNHGQSSMHACASFLQVSAHSLNLTGSAMYRGEVNLRKRMPITTLLQLSPTLSCDERTEGTHRRCNKHDPSYLLVVPSCTSAEPLLSYAFLMPSWVTRITSKGTSSPQFSTIHIYD